MFEAKLPNECDTCATVLMINPIICDSMMWDWCGLTAVSRSITLWDEEWIWVTFWLLRESTSPKLLHKQITLKFGIKYPMIPFNRYINLNFFNCVCGNCSNENSIHWDKQWWNTVVTLDQEKVYNKIRHDYLWKTLEAFNLPQPFINTIQSLYRNTLTMVAINGIQSNLSG